MLEERFLKQREEVFIPPHVVAWWSLCIYLISPHLVAARSSSSPSDPPTASDKTLSMALVATLTYVALFISRWEKPGSRILPQNRVAAHRAQAPHGVIRFEGWYRRAQT